MTIALDQALSDLYFAGTTKAARSGVIVTALGDNRRLVLKHNGAVFYDATMTGPIKVVAGDINDWGVVSNATVNNAVDLSSGTSTLEIIGNGHVVSGSYGLTSASDFWTKANPNGVDGVAFAIGSGLKAYRYLPTGTGPAAPPKTDTMLDSVELYDKSVGGVTTLVGARQLSARRDDFIYQHPLKAQTLGDVAVYQTATDLVWGNFLFGGTLALSHAGNTESGLNPLQQFACNWSFRSSTYTGYPLNTNYVRSIVLVPPPHIVVGKNKLGEVLFIGQMHGGEAINDRSLTSGRNNASGQSRDATHAMQPSTNVAMCSFVWFSDRIKISPLAPRFFPGLRDWRESKGKDQSTFNAVEPLFTGGYDRDYKNGLGDFWYAPEWPEKYIPLTLTDPYLDNTMNRSGSSAQYQGWAEGWRYEPGSYQCINWYTTPGGPRPGRCHIHAILAMALTYPNGNRLQGNVPYADMGQEHLKALFNLSNHFCLSPSTLYLAPNQEFIDGVWGYSGTYYGNYASAKTIYINNDQRSGTGPANYDADGNLVYNGCGIDYLHDYNNRGMHANLYCSPLSSIYGKFDTISSIMIQDRPDQSGAGRDKWMIRRMAWELRSLAIAWFDGTTNALGFTQAEIEERIVAIFKVYHRDVVVPVFKQNEDSAYARGLRNLGTPLVSTGSRWQSPTGWLAFYASQSLQFMKQIGLLKILYEQKGIECKEVIQTYVACLNKFCNDFILDTSGFTQYSYQFVGDGVSLDTIPTSWANWWDTEGKNLPQNLGGNTFVKGGAYAPPYGVYFIDFDVGAHNVQSHPALMLDYLPEFPNPRGAAARAKFLAYEDEITARVDAATTPDAKRKADWSYMHPGVHPWKSPDPSLLAPPIVY